MTNKLSLKL
jgi:hypothetical protein